MYVYIHIPFCASICSYCDFPKVFYDKKYILNYLLALEKEIASRYQNEEVASIYIGGGTPTSLDLEELDRLFQITKRFKKGKNIEFTMESNVECLDKEKILLLKKYGVNRVSLGVQSFDENTLRELNRKHTEEDVFLVIDNLKKSGIDNLSIDYIYGVHSDIDRVKKDMDTFLKLDIPHISSYALIIEEGTVFGIHKRHYIEEDIELDMYHSIRDILEKNGYVHYEISNYAKEGYQSIHNINYWNNGYYYGFGMGAVSYLNHYRICNTKSLTKYIDGNYLNDSIYEDVSVDMSNTFILGFRMVKGIDVIQFKEKYHKEVTDIDPVKRLLDEGKLVLEDNRLFIHSDYFYLSNEIMMEFV